MKKIVINKTIILFLNINDIISLKQTELKKIKEEHLLNYDNCIIYNYYDLMNHKLLIKDKFNKLKFCDQKRINARDCIIKVINNDNKNTFLNVNHIQGTDKSQFFYGAYNNDILIAVMTFDNIKGVNGGIKNNEFDLSRFSVKTGFIVVGIFNRLLKKFINDYKPNKIISFADLNYVNKTSNIYENNGFKLVKNIQPDFKLLIKNHNNLYHKFTYGNKFFKNTNISKNIKEDIKNNSYRVWNCGKLKYELYIDNNKNIVIGFIYMINNKINNKKYIGQTTRSLNKRIYEYKAAYKYNKFYNQHLLGAFQKYGWDNFEFSIIDTAQTIEELNAKEIRYIIQYQTTDKTKGYNIESGGDNAIPDIETLNKMSKSHFGIKQTDNWINKRVAKAGTEEAKKYGKKKTEEEKQLLSKNSPKYWLNKKRNEETKQKISETKKKIGLTDKQKEIICKKVYKIDTISNQIIGVFESTTHASISENVNQSTISRRCSKNKIKKNILWRY
jgi:group I intron endonuclease